MTILVAAPSVPSPTRHIVGLGSVGSTAWVLLRREAKGGRGWLERVSSGTESTRGCVSGRRAKWVGCWGAERVRSEGSRLAEWVAQRGLCPGVLSRRKRSGAEWGRLSGSLTKAGCGGLLLGSEGVGLLGAAEGRERRRGNNSLCRHPEGIVSWLGHGGGGNALVSEAGSRTGGDAVSGLGGRAIEGR